MPIYKGSNEVTSGNLRKGSTNIENGYKETSPFYTNTNGITINFVDAISGATMNTTQFSSVGVPGASFSSFSRTITVDSGRIFSTNPTVSESGDSGNNVTTSISSQTSTSAVLNVSGTYPTSGTTVTLTVNGATQVQLPNLVVTQNGNYPLTTTGDGGALGTYNYSISNSSGCVGGSSGSGSINGGSGSSNTYYSYSRPSLAGGPYGNGCGMTCNSSFTSSKSGYNAGSTTFSQTGTYPSSSYTCSVSATGFRSNTSSVNVTSPSCSDTNPSYYGSAINVSGGCLLTTTVSFGQGSSVCNNGFSCTGTVSGTCPSGSVPKNGTSSISSTGTCEARNGTSKNASATVSPSKGTSGSSYFYINNNGSGTVTVNNDSASIVQFYVTTTCTNGRGGSKTVRDYIYGTNGQGSGSSFTLSENQNFSASGWGTSPGLQTGDSIGCNSNYTAENNNYNTKALGSGSVSFTL